MAPLPTISDVYRVALIWSGPGSQRAVNVIHIYKAASNSAAVAAAVDAAAVAGMWSQVVNGASVIRLDVTKLDGSSALYSLAVTGAKWTGSAGAVDHMPAVAEVVSLKTAFRGRRYRGRTYIPFIGESAQSNGGIVGYAAAQTGWNTFLTNLTAAGFTWSVASYKGGLSSPVTSVAVKPFAATQRRRQSRLAS